MELSGADRKSVVNAGNDGFVGESVVAADLGRQVELRLITLEQRRELVEPRPRRAAAGDNAEVGLAQARLHRVDVDVLQELRLQQFADAGDFATRPGGVDIGEEPVGAGVAGS